MKIHKLVRQIKRQYPDLLAAECCPLGAAMWWQYIPTAIATTSCQPSGFPKEESAAKVLGISSADAYGISDAFDVEGDEDKAWMLLSEAFFKRDARTLAR